MIIFSEWRFRMFSCRVACAVLVLAGLLSACMQASARAQAGLTVLAPQDAPTNTQIEQALDQIVEFDGTRVTLEQLFKDISTNYGINTLLDEQSLRPHGIYASKKMLTPTGRMPLRAALKLMLAQDSLIWTIREDTLVVTVSDTVSDTVPQIIKIYPVADFITSFDREDRDADFGSLVELITITVEPMSWEELGGRGTIAWEHSSASIVVVQAAEQHATIEALLATLRAARAKQPAIPSIRPKSCTAQQRPVARRSESRRSVNRRPAATTWRSTGCGWGLEQMPR